MIRISARQRLVAWIGFLLTWGLVLADKLETLRRVFEAPATALTFWTMASKIFVETTLIAWVILAIGFCCLLIATSDAWRPPLSRYFPALALPQKSSTTEVTEPRSGRLSFVEFAKQAIPQLSLDGGEEPPFLLWDLCLGVRQSGADGEMSLDGKRVEQGYDNDYLFTRPFERISVSDLASLEIVCDPWNVIDGENDNVRAVSRDISHEYRDIHLSDASEAANWLKFNWPSCRGMSQAKLKAKMDRGAQRLSEDEYVARREIARHIEMQLLPTLRGTPFRRTDADGIEAAGMICSLVANLDFRGSQQTLEYLEMLRIKASSAFGDLENSFAANTRFPGLSSDNSAFKAVNQEWWSAFNSVVSLIRDHLPTKLNRDGIMRLTERDVGDWTTANGRAVAWCEQFIERSYK